MGDSIDTSLQSFTLFTKLTLAILILWLLKLGITMLIHNKDDIEIATEFPCFLGHPVVIVLFQDMRGVFFKKNYK